MTFAMALPWRSKESTPLGMCSLYFFAFETYREGWRFFLLLAVINPNDRFGFNKIAKLCWPLPKKFFLVILKSNVFLQRETYLYPQS